MLESFVATQKLSVQKALRKKFRRFLSAKADFNGLVLLKLQVGPGICSAACRLPQSLRAPPVLGRPVLAARLLHVPSSVEHAVLRCALPPRRLQECLRDARRVEAITGQQEDRDNYVVPVR